MCRLWSGEIDIAKEVPNVTRMKLLGAEVVPVGFGGRSLKEAVDSAFQAYVPQADKALFAIGSVVGPHPFPMMVRDFQHVVGHVHADDTSRLPHDLGSDETNLSGSAAEIQDSFAWFEKAGRISAAVIFGNDFLGDDFEELLVEDILVGIPDVYLLGLLYFVVYSLIMTEKKIVTFWGKKKKPSLWKTCFFTKIWHFFKMFS